MGKLKLRIMNIVYLLLSGVALFWYSLNFIAPDKAPFLKLGIDAELTAENSEFLDSFLGDLGIKREDLFESGPIEIQADIQVKNSMLLDVWKADDATAFVDNTFIQPNVDGLITSLEPTFKGLAKSAAKSALKTQMEEQLKDTLGSSEDLYAALLDKDPALSEAKLSEDIGAVVDALLAEDATIENVSTILAEKYNTYNTVLGGEEKTAEQMEEEIKSTFEDLGLVDEDGNISNIDEVIASLLDGFLGGDSDDGEEGNKGDALFKLINPSYEGTDPNEENPISVKLKAFLNSKLSDETKQLIVVAFKGCGVALGVFMLGWAIKLVQVIIGFFSKKPYVRKEIIGILGGIVQFLLAVISVALILVFRFGGLAAIGGIPVVGGMITEFLNGIPLISALKSVELTFSAMIPGILCVVNFAYSFIYGIAKRKFKRDYKKGKIA